jgi:hypothetical protein
LPFLSLKRTFKYNVMYSNTTSCIFTLLHVYVFCVAPRTADILLTMAFVKESNLTVKCPMNKHNLSTNLCIYHQGSLAVQCHLITGFFPTSSQDKLLTFKYHVRTTLLCEKIQFECLTGNLDLSFIKHWNTATKYWKVPADLCTVKTLHVLCAHLLTNFTNFHILRIN